MPHIFLYLVYSVDMVLTTLYTLFNVDSSAVKFYACELTEKLDFLTILVLQIVSAVKNYFDIVKFMQVPVFFQSIMV